MYHLTEDQKEVFKWIIAQLSTAKLGDDFEVQLRGNEFDLVLPASVTAAISTRLPSATFASLTALVGAKCLESVPSVIPPEFGRRSFVLTGYGRRGAETNFAEIPAALPCQAFTFNTTVHDSSNVQIGNQNQMEIQSALESVVRVINNATATPAEKALAKGILAQAFENSTVAAVLGSLASTAVRALTK